MFNMKTSLAVLAAATLATAQNGTVIISPVPGQTGGDTNINISIDVTFTQTFLQLCPTGLIPVPYEFQQHCPGGCGQYQPPVPYGWEVQTTTCDVCGPKPTVVTITTCPYANGGGSYPTPCAGCYTDVVKYTPVPTCNGCPAPPVTTVTNVYPPPTSTYCPPGVTTTPAVPTIYTSACPECPKTPYTQTSACPTCPKTYVPATTPVTKPNQPYNTTPVVAPPAYTGAASKKEVGAGLMVAGAVAIAALL